MLQWLLKRWRKAPEDYEQEVYGRGSDAFERARLAEEEGAERNELYGEDVSVEEKEPEGAEPLREKDKKSSYEEGPEEAAEEEEEEEETPGGVFISDEKIKGGFKIFGISLLSIFLLPWILSFGIAVVALISLVVFPIALSLFPIFLVGLFILVVVAPLIMPLLIIYLLITERGKLLINSEGRLLWLTFPSAIRKEEEQFERAEELLTEDYLQPEEPLR
jgi:hypothetical protein